MAKRKPDDDASEAPTNPGIKIRKPERIVVLRYHAKWCGPCQQMEPHWRKFVMAHPELECRSINVDGRDPTIKQLDVMSVPVVAFCLERQGAQEPLIELGRVNGYATLTQLETRLARARQKEA